MSENPEGLGASEQPDGHPGEPTEITDAPKVADPDSGEDDEVAQTN